jgi:hypothetical protein
VVKLKTGKTVKGKLLSAGDHSFVFEPGKANLFDPRPAPVSFTYLDVQSIKLGCGSKWRAILAIGVPVGLMAAAGAAINSQSHSPTGGEAAGVTFALGGGGAVAGYFWGKSLDCRSH